VTQPLLQAADLRSAASLSPEAVAGLAGLVEALHARMVTLPRIPGLGDATHVDERAMGVTGLAYKTVRGVPHLGGGTLDGLLGWLAPALAATDPHLPPDPEREAILAALNGVLGDHLATTGNPLAIPMQFRLSGRPVPLGRHAIRSHLGTATPKLLVLLHGLCMNDLQWRHEGHDHGEALAQALGYTPIYLYYNSGLSVSTNGRILAQLMEGLYSVWPMRIERLTMLGHNMGGLVARSAIHHSAQIQRGALRWPGRVDDLICLGTPHHGAPLARIGQGLAPLLGAAPYAAPLARLGKVRSAGIHDFRFGNVLRRPTDDDGEPGQADPVALPGGTRCFAVAASLSRTAGSPKADLLGDGLVPVASALGQHDNPALSLAFDPAHRAVVYDTGHLGLLSSPEVAALLARWLG
jgi:hypothetical protein